MPLFPTPTHWPETNSGDSCDEDILYSIQSLLSLAYDELLEMKAVYGNIIVVYMHAVGSGLPSQLLEGTERPVRKVMGDATENHEKSRYYGPI